jgi:hypothetical protein
VAEIRVCKAVIPCLSGQAAEVCQVEGGDALR